MTTSPGVPEPSAQLLRLATEVRQAAMALGQSDDNQRRKALVAMANSLLSSSEKIVRANRLDLEKARTDGLASALMARLKLDESKLNSAIEGLRQLTQLSDPLGLRQLHRELDKDLVLERITVPLGVLGVIFEARPDAV
ncbi:MAG: gamma-glutamyl-phosphate reductase, partial [Cyanobacteriota bacterium]|nr:gamma-glutamyl-phosphate reductase [Cyanobacteriota bacterium]